MEEQIPMRKRCSTFVFTVAIFFGVASLCLGQQASSQSSPTPSSTLQNKSTLPADQEPIRINVEEVQIPIAAYDGYGHLDPTLELRDLMLLENGVPQELRSLRRIPASVLLLLDTGGELNPAKNIRTTRAIASRIVATLASPDRLAVIQFNNRVELLQDWTNDKTVVTQALNTKLLSGKRAALSPAIIAAADYFRGQPIGNRHLVLITDGAESANTKAEREAAVATLMNSNAVLQVISYLRASQSATKASQRIISKRDKSPTPDAVVDTLPDDPGYNQLRALHKPGGILIDGDPQRRRQIQDYEESMREGDYLFGSLTQETGGKIWRAESVEQMVKDGEAAARLIDSEFLITYRPARPLAARSKDEIRRIQVVSRRVGLNVVSRRSVVSPSNDEPR